MPDKELQNIDPDKVARVVLLVFGQLANSTTPFWCYVAVKPSKYEISRRLAREKSLDLTTFESQGFGEIIVSGEGAFPPNEVTRQVAETFEVPIRQLFADIDPNAEIYKQIELIKKELGEV